MYSILQRPAVDSDICRGTYLEQPGDIAEDVRRCNLITDPAKMPQGTGYAISNIESPLPFHILATPHQIICINVGSSFRADMNIAGVKSTASIGPGSILAMPAGCDARVAYRGLNAYRFLTLACRADHLEKTAFSAGLALPPQGMPPTLSAEPDAQMLSVSQAIMAELQNEQCMPMLVETLTLALSIQVLRRASGAATKPPPAPSGLAPHALRRVIDYMHAHIEEAVAHVREPATGVIDLHARDTQVRQNDVGVPGACHGERLPDAREVEMVQQERVPDFRQSLFRPRQVGRIEFQADQSSRRPDAA